MPFNPNHTRDVPGPLTICRPEALDVAEANSRKLSQIHESSNVQNSVTTPLTHPKHWVRTLKRSGSNFDARNRAGLLTRSKNWLRTMIYPGLDLHTRNRASLCVFWKTGRRDVLDAGSGNGYFSWLAYQSGARVLAVSFDKEQLEKARGFLVQYRGADEARLEFAKFNLNDLPSMDRKFDEIICYETSRTYTSG